MAAQLLGEDLVTCSICLCPYLDPVTLPCGHSFCGTCIQDSWRCCEKTCPECRQPFPEGAKLCRNVTLSTLLQALPRALQAQPPATLRAEPSASHSASCPRHGRPLEFFCRTEGLCVCSACTVHECRHHERALLDVERRGREDQLKARVVVTRQQVSEAESQLQELQLQKNQIESSACTLASAVTSRFSSLFQALEKQKALTLRSIEVGKKQALGQALSETQRLTSHLEALSQYDRSVQDLLGQVDNCIFFQELRHLSEPVQTLGPLPALQWDEEEQLNTVNELLSPLCRLLLEDKPSRVAGKAAQAGPVEALGPPPAVPSTMCPLRKKLWQNYRNLTFDPDTANQYLSLSHEDQQVTHRFQAQRAAGPGSFELWQVQCTQSFQAGQHYWEVRASDHSVTLGVTYPKLSRRKVGNHTDNIGRGPCSWGLCIQEDNIQAWHNGKVERLHGVPGRLLGVDLNLASGCLNFYSLEPQTERLHTFYAVFSQPLFPVFWLLEGRTLTLCHQPEAKLPPGPREEASALS
ncbi:tripartite motif-containing protein 65 [Phodopus roborovskii]|uniref:Trim65 protein n=1 Tax=Phodopus roborovskii TaxID=109678 RepID=A0AAU9YP47_PHORO|nr:tripartite motif-containing protein 65 [Phodopus roborovskii]CAH6776439.1 Trim65 [Phodopus roborovskii]